MMRLGIDLDGCVSNFNRKFVEHLNNQGNKVPMDYTPNTYGYDDLVLKKPIKEYILDFWQTNNYQKLDLIDTARLTLNSLHEEGHELYIITNRKFNAERDTEGWLKKNDIPYDSLIFTRNKGLYANHFNLDLFVEDCLENVNDIIKNGVDCCIYNQSWNKDISNYQTPKCDTLEELLFDHKTKRIFSWLQFHKTVKFKEQFGRLK